MSYKLIFILLWNIMALFADDRPEFKGKSLRSYIDNVLIYPEYSKDNCLQGTVHVSFKLDRQGRIYQSEVQKGFGTDLDMEALRVVRLTSGKWVMPPDYDTLVSMILPVNFSLRDFKCEERSRDDINAAIAAFHARKGMSEVIFNYYDKKAVETFSAADELRIQNLKYQLGYDEKFIDRLLKQAQRKLKQGDLEGACEDFGMIRSLGSDKSATFLAQNCR